ncbi:MAG: TlpA disulfide reductase family protein [Xanthomarina sp.]
MFKIVFVLLFFIASPFYSISQQYHFILKIHFNDPSVKTLGIGEAYYYKHKPYYAAKIKLDSAKGQDSTYLFEGSTLYPTPVRIWPQGASYFFNKLIFIDTGYQEITLIKKDSSYIINSNTDIEREHHKFLDEMGIKTIDDKIDGSKLLSYVQKNPDSYVALFAIINQAFNYSYLDIFEKINDKFSEKIKQTKAFQYYLNLYSHKSAEPTDPDFLGTSLLGKKVYLSDIQGKGVVLLDFWGSWCKPCRQMIPHLKDLYQTYHSKDFQIVSIAFDNNSQDWKKAVKEEGIQSWINVIAGQSYSLNDTTEVGRKYAIREFPTMILIDKEGSIIARYDSKHDSESDLDKKLREIFKRQF